MAFLLQIVDITINLLPQVAGPPLQEEITEKNSFIPITIALLRVVNGKKLR